MNGIKKLVEADHRLTDVEAPASTSRRKVLIGGATAIAGALVATTSPRLFAANGDTEIRIGFISPRSGGLGLFGQSDPYVLQLARKAFASGISSGGRTYRVTILDRDSQSSPARASELTNELISKHKVHLMLSTSTPEVVNPVSDACEAAGIPSVGTVCPLESFFFGRGGELGKPSPFKWSFDFSFGMQGLIKMYLAVFPQLKTNRKIAALYPNDADGTTLREHLIPVLRQHGYTVIDAGPYQDGTTDYSEQITLFNRENCQIFNTVPLPPDFSAFWRQAAQLHYAQRVVIAELDKTGLFPNQIEQLGTLGYNLTISATWLPVFPYRSPLTLQSSSQLASGYEKATGHQWTMTLGNTLALFEIANKIFATVAHPASRDEIREAIASLNMATTAGRVNFKTGPYPNTAESPIIGAQWIRTPPGSKYPLNLVSVDNANDPNVPVQQRLLPYKLLG